MNEPWSFYLERYADPDLLPVHCLTAICCLYGWVLTSPFRAVAWTFLTEVWRVVCLNASMVSEFLSRYQLVVGDANLRGLRGPAYAFALWGALFTVPEQVSVDDRDKNGKYGEMNCAWWTAMKVTFYEFLPDLKLKTCESTRKYAWAILEAGAACWRRVYAVLCGLCWIVLLLLSLTIHLPMAVFDLMQYVLCSGPGVFIALLVLNALNCYFQWVNWAFHASGGFLIIGLVTHAWRQGEVGGKLQGIEPGVTMENALKSVRTNANQRQRLEAAILRQLQQDEIEELVDLQNTKSVQEPNEDAVNCVRAPTAVSAELREAENRVKLLRQEMVADTELRVKSAIDDHDSFTTTYEATEA